MSDAKHIFIGANSDKESVELIARMANRHGLICGATGTGKTITLQVLAEQFSKLGVPVIASDVKGDLSGITQAGEVTQRIQSRLDAIGLESFEPGACPTVFWDVFGEEGHRVRTTISEMGPLLLGQLLGLNETQQGVIDIAFRAADEQGLLLLDLKDLREMLAWVGDNASELRSRYGNIAPQSVGAIQRKLLSLEDRGGLLLFGEPALSVEDLMLQDLSGRGIVSLIQARRLIQDPKAYVTLLLWLLSELFEELPEVGDQELPKLVFFFDEAHLLFDRVPDAFVEKVETVVRLIRSKGVSVFFVTQHPADIPDSVCSQLGNRVQHALRAFTPGEKKAVKAAAESFRENSAFDAQEVLLQLGVGEALVSTLDEKGVPKVVQKTLIAPPRSRIGPASSEERQILISRSPVSGRYDQDVDRESAYEVLQKRKVEEAGQVEEVEKKSPKSRRQSPTEAFFKSMLRSIGSSIGRQVARGVLGSFLGKGKKR